MLVSFLDPGGNSFGWNNNIQADYFTFFVACASPVGTPLLNPNNIDQPKPTQYIHSYHTDIKNLVKNSNTVGKDTKGQILCGSPLQPMATSILTNWTFLLVPLPSTMPNMIGILRYTHKQLSLILTFTSYIISWGDILSSRIPCLLQLFLTKVAYCS